MLRFGRRETRNVILLSIFTFCWGCAAPAPAPKSPVASERQETQGSQVQNPLGAASAQPRAGRVQDIRIQEGRGEVLVFLTGDGAFVDFEIQRMGEDQFLLQLKDIDPTGGLPSNLPISDRLSLASAPMDSGKGTEIIGTVKGRLDRYSMSTSGNDLVLALAVGEAQYVPPSTSLSHSSAAADSSAKKRTKVIPASAVSARAQDVKPTPIPPPKAKAPDVFAAPPREHAAVHGEQGTLLVPTDLPQMKQYVGKPISLDLVDADVRNVLRLISEVTGTNIVIDPEATGSVTLKVEQVPWDQVLDMVLAMNKLGKEQHGNITRIATLEKLQRVTEAKKEDIKAKSELSKEAQDLGDIITVYFQVNYAMPTEIAGRLRELMSGNGRVTCDEKTRFVIYTDYMSRVENARTLVSKLDKQTSQVLIEARIVTMTTSLARTLGTNFGLTISPNNSYTKASQNTGTWSINSPETNFLGFSMLQLFGHTWVDLTLTLAAYEDTSELDIVASPKVVTLDNVKATVTQGTQIPYLQLNETGTVASTQFVNAVVELQVVPHITPDGKIRMEIQVKQDEPTSQTYTSNQQPGIETRKITTEMLVDDGNIVMIGGVLRNRDSSSEQRTPGLYKIPIIGSLFKMDTMNKEKTELVIFISPKIVEATRAM